MKNLIKKQSQIFYDNNAIETYPNGWHSVRLSTNPSKEDGLKFSETKGMVEYHIFNDGSWLSEFDNQTGHQVNVK